MEKVIEGKIYNTKTAEQIATYWNGYGRDDQSFLDETLYRTKKGNWFLHGAGGINTDYAMPSRYGRMAGSETLAAMSEDQAYNWLKSHDELRAIEEYFSDRIEDA